MMITLLVFAAVFTLSERQKAEKSVYDNGKTLARFSADTIYDYYLQFYTHPRPEDFDNFKKRVKAILDYNTDITSTSLISINGRVLFDSKELTSGKYSGTVRTISDERTIEAARGSVVASRDLPSVDERSTEIVVPILDTTGSHYLAMRYVLNYKSLNKSLRTIYQRIVVMSLLLLTFAVAAAIALSRQITRPIARITQVAEQIRWGNFDVLAQSTKKDEIGRLADAINQMAHQLKTYYRDLEEKVRERTRALELAQAKLQANVNRDDSLLASIGDGVLAVDHSGKIVLVNTAAEAMLKIQKDKTIGKPYGNIFALATEKGKSVKTEKGPMYLALKKGITAASSEYYYSGKSGKETIAFPVAINAAPVSLNNKIMGAIMVFRDITKEKEVDRKKNEFISLASHQLRTPLSAIKWFGEMLLNGDAGKLKPEQKDFAQNIADSTERMIQLVNSLLNISRIESGRIIVDPKPTDLKQLVDSVVQDLAASIQKKRHNLVVSVHKDLGPINVDPRLISQVYMNLLTNAIKYTPAEGEINIFISRKDDEIISQVTDSGYGIPEKQQKDVFQKFFRANNAVKVESEGTGLGLYLVKAIIESSGGKIWFKSEENKGTTFWFSLPAAGMKAKEGEVTLA